MFWITCNTFFICQASNSDMTIVAFLIFPAKTSNFNVESLHGQAISKQLKETVALVQEKVGKRIYESALRYGYSNAAFRLACCLPLNRFDGDICTTAQGRKLYLTLRDVQAASSILPINH